MGGSGTLHIRPGPISLHLQLFIVFVKLLGQEEIDVGLPVVAVSTRVFDPLI